jgi:hypothetical protein
MVELSWPSVATPSEFTLSRYAKVFRGTSAFGKSGQNIDMLNDRWKVTCSVSVRSYDDSAELEAFVNRLRSGSGIVRCHHFARPVIRGVLTNPTTAAIAKGSQTLTLNCAAGNNLKAGDMLGVGDQLFQVALDCKTDTTTLSVPVTMRSRKAVSAGLAIITSEPTGKFRLASAASTSFGPGGVIMGTTLNLVEVVN